MARALWPRHIFATDIYHQFQMFFSFGRRERLITRIIKRNPARSRIHLTASAAPFISDQNEF